MAKKSPEKYKTYGNVFDNFTLRNLFKLESQGYFEDPLYPVALGKEANVFYAFRSDGKKVIVKIYRLETCDFTKMYSYIKTDERYQNISKKRRNVIFSWTQREFRNLYKARDAGVSVPAPLHFFNNILIEEFIGNDSVAPMLKDSDVENVEVFFDEIMDNYKKMYKGGLVHGDLSSFNILNFNQKPVFIDFSQAIETKNPASIDLLNRDVKNLSTYFKKLGLDISEEEIMKKIKS